jgi:uncharacterized membrane protein (DUF4010 family)
MARRSRDGDLHVLTAAVTVIAASTIMFPRVLLETWLLNAPLAASLALPIAVATVLGLASAYLLHRIPNGRTVPPHTVNNPLNFGLALQFALVYMGVRWLVAFAMDSHGAASTYAAAVLSGATDMDAITLSMARAARNGDLATARNALLRAATSNTLFKLGITLVLGNKRLASRVAIGLGAALAGGLAAAWIGG